MAPMRPGDWLCALCENHNFAKRDTCNKCDGPKTEGTEVAERPKAEPPVVNEGDLKEGDWVCADCGNHNFASRVNCNRKQCGALKPGTKQGDWVCRGCRNHNFAKRTACKMCQKPKDDFGGKGGKGGGGPCVPFGGHMAMMDPYGMKGGWGGGDPYGMGGKGMGGGWGGCDPYGMKGGYGKGMYGMDPYSAPYGAYGKGMSPMMKGGGKAMVAPSGKGGGGKDMKQGDWNCGMCGNHNFASRTTCNSKSCMAPRPGFKEGDWICRDCRNHNFASREDCNSCKKPKA